MSLKQKFVMRFMALSLLTTLLTFFAFVSVQANVQTNSSNIPPDMPQDALQYNRTDITPQGVMETVQAMEMNVFFYRNFTLMVNSTRNCEMNVTIMAGYLFYWMDFPNAA